jgi:hypothetical protein
MPYAAPFRELPTATVSFNLQNPGFNPPFTCWSSSHACWNCMQPHRRLSTQQPVFCSPTHSWPTGHSAVRYRILLHVHTVALPYYKHLHPLLCELTGSQLPNGWPFPVPRVIGFHIVIVAVLQMMVFLAFHTKKTCVERFWRNVVPPPSRWQSCSGGCWSNWEVM